MIPHNNGVRDLGFNSVSNDGLVVFVLSSHDCSTTQIKIMNLESICLFLSHLRGIHELYGNGKEKTHGKH